MESGRPCGLFVHLSELSDTKDKVEYEEATIDSIFLGRLELQFKKNRSLLVWKDDEKVSGNLKLLGSDSENDLNSSRTTEMEIDDDDDYFDEL